MCVLCGSVLLATFGPAVRNFFSFCCLLISPALYNLLTCPICAPFQATQLHLSCFHSIRETDPQTDRPSSETTLFSSTITPCAIVNTLLASTPPSQYLHPTSTHLHYHHLFLLNNFFLYDGIRWSCPFHISHHFIGNGEEQRQQFLTLTEVLRKRISDQR